MDKLLVRLAIVAGLLLALPALVGCASSASSKSISNSISSPFKWSSSSSPGGDSAMYRDDVERTTVAHARDGGDVRGLRRSLASLAEGQGITRWEDDPATRAGVRDGLHASGLPEAEMHAFAARLVGDGSTELLR